jgi:succinoglycan biosynthesis transport protein ExoP
MAEMSGESRTGLLFQARHYWNILLRWKWTAFLFFALAVSAAAVFSFVATPVYTANGSVWIEDEPNILPFEEVQSLGPETTVQSHARLFQSRTLASDIIEKLKLYENPDFAGRPSRKDPLPDPADPVFREKLVLRFIGNVTYSVGMAPTERIRLVNVGFSNRSPKLAAEILNAIFDGYIDMIVRKRYSASEQATTFLDGQIAELRTEIESRERELNKLGSEKDILPLTAEEAPAVSRIAEINKALTDATIDKINKLNAYNQLKAAPLGEIPNAPEGSLIQRLREQYTTLSRQYNTRLASVRPEYPEMRRMKSELDAATEALQNETQNLIRIAYGEYQTSVSKEQSLQRQLEREKTQAYNAKSDSVIYNSLRVELENRKSLLDTLSKRKSETDVSSRLKGLEALNVWVVDKANLPLKPAFPDKPKNILIGFLVGLAGGLGLVFGLEHLNHTVKTSKDVLSAIGVPTLGAVPAFDAETKPKGPRGELAKVKAVLLGRGEFGAKKEARKKRDRSVSLMDRSVPPTEPGPGRATNMRIELIALREPQAIQSESYRSIRTTLFVSSPPGKIKALLLTSPLAREGKSSTISNLGVTLAEAQKRVVIIDSDLRKPRQARIFGINSNGGPGLSGYLSSLIEPADIIKPTGVPNLSLVPSGHLPSNPIELLTSERMDGLVAFLKRGFDFVLFDTPPILAVSDALAMGPMADAIILIARGGLTPVQAIRQAKQKLDAHKLRCHGVIINGVDLMDQDGYYARQYYHYSKAE